MKLQPLPVCPNPYRDETMSSWLERIGLFYGISYHGAIAALFPHQGPAAWDIDDGLDGDLATHHALCEWTGRRANDVPAPLDLSNGDTMPPSARLTYCPVCWDEDVAAGRQPYVRSNWTRWTAVHCARHEIWLSARAPRQERESRVRGWIDLWRSRQRWAQAFDLRHDTQAGACAFQPATFDQPTGHWTAFEAAVRKALGRDRDEQVSPFSAGSIVAIIASDAFALLRRKIRTVMQIRPAPMRVDELDLRCYARPEPMWITNRIVCLAIAVEFVQLLAKRPPLFPRVRPLLECAECVWSLRSLQSRLTISDNFPQRSIGGLSQSQH